MEPGSPSFLMAAESQARLDMETGPGPPDQRGWIGKNSHFPLQSLECI